MFVMVICLPCIMFCNYHKLQKDRTSQRYHTMAVNVFATTAATENLSRHEMLEWVNDCLQSQFSKIEQLHTGAGYCLLMDVIFPGLIQLKKVKWSSKNELDSLANWKLVLNAFKDVQVEKILPVEKLMKGKFQVSSTLVDYEYAFKFQDNFELLKWWKKFFEANYDGHEYDPVEMRGNEPLPNEIKFGDFQTNSSFSSIKKGSTSSLNGPTPTRSVVTCTRRHPVINCANTSYTTPTSSKATHRIAAAAPSQSFLPEVPSSMLMKNDAQIAQLENELKEAWSQVTHMDEAVTALERERDFYFSKLRSIEVMCQDGKGQLDVNEVLGILYETEEGFAVPTENESSSDVDL